MVESRIKRSWVAEHLGISLMVFEIRQGAVKKPEYQLEFRRVTEDKIFSDIKRYEKLKDAYKAFIGMREEIIYRASNEVLV